MTNPAQPPEQALRVALLLSAAGGFLDSFTWLAHGRVFANAQTGNVVLLGLSAALGDWTQALHHIPPIIAFILGVFTAHRLRKRAADRDAHEQALLGLAFEIVVLAAVAAAPAWSPDLPIVLAIAFVAALQSSSFGRVEGAAYSSVMTTGNLRRAVECLFAGNSADSDAPALRQARVFGAICLCFAAGTALGAFATSRLGVVGLANAALVLPIALLALALLLCRQPAKIPPKRSSPVD